MGHEGRATERQSWIFLSLYLAIGLVGTYSSLALYFQHRAYRDFEAAYEDFNAQHYPRAIERLEASLDGFGSQLIVLSSTHEHRRLLGYSLVATDNFAAAARHFAKLAASSSDPMVHAAVGMSAWIADDREYAGKFLAKLSDCGWCDQARRYLALHAEASRDRDDALARREQLVDAMRKPAGCLASQLAIEGTELATGAYLMPVIRKSLRAYDLTQMAVKSIEATAGRISKGFAGVPAVQLAEFCSHLRLDAASDPSRIGKIWDEWADVLSFVDKHKHTSQGAASLDQLSDLARQWYAEFGTEVAKDNIVAVSNEWRRCLRLALVEHSATFTPRGAQLKALTPDLKPQVGGWLSQFNPLARMEGAVTQKIPPPKMC